MAEAREGSGRNIRSLKLLAKEIGGGELKAIYDLPNWAFAAETHESLAGPASASHFSIATL